MPICFSRLVRGTYEKVTKDVPAHISKFKVVAGIVMTRGLAADDALVVCVTTGSKCISGSHLSMEGETINDCHAEILARRCLVNYIYDQLDLFVEDAPRSIFETSAGSQLLKLKDNILFHLYISSAPCGDARIFSLDEGLSSPFQDPHPNRQGRGVLRTKIESGEG